MYAHKGDSGKTNLGTGRVKKNSEIPLAISFMDSLCSYINLCVQKCKKINNKYSEPGEVILECKKINSEPGEVILECKKINSEPGEVILECMNILNDLKRIYNIIFDVNSILALNRRRNITLTREHVEESSAFLDERIKYFNSVLPELKRFINVTELSSDCSKFDMARTQCRIAEVYLVDAFDKNLERYCKVYTPNYTELKRPPQVEEASKFINRLSLYLFYVQRMINSFSHNKEVYR